MIRPQIPIFIALVGFAAASADNMRDDWLPASDGFAWPASKRIETKSGGLEELDEAFRVQAAIDLRGPGDEEPKLAIFAEIDLNHDGRSELILKIPRLGGSAGYFYQIYATRDDGVRRLGWFQGFELKVAEPKDGWAQIEATSKAGPGEFQRMLLGYGENGYKITRSEFHDFVKKRVTIRIGKAEGEETDGPNAPK